MRRVFIIRKDLHLSPGKLAAQVGHCCEAYWMNLLKRMSVDNPVEVLNEDTVFRFKVDVPKNVWIQYVCGIFTKTICEARNKNHLLKAETIAKELHLAEGVDYGFINDKCLTELKPENEDGTTTVGMWFAPLADEVAHKISRKFPLYRDHFSVECPDKVSGHFDLTKEENSPCTEAERIRRFQEICKQSEGGLQTFKGGK